MAAATRQQMLGLRATWLRPHAPLRQPALHLQAPQRRLQGRRDLLLGRVAMKGERLSCAARALHVNPVCSCAALTPAAQRCTPH